MAKNLLQLSIRTQITLVIFVVTSLAIIIISILHVYWKIGETREAAVNMSTSVANVMSQDAVQVLVLNSADATADMVLKLESFHSISQAIFFDKQKSPLLSYKRRGVNVAELVFFPSGTVITDGSYITSYVPLQYQSHNYGTAAFRIRLEPFSEVLLTILKKELSLVPVLIILSYLLAILFHRIFTRPLENIVNVLQRHGESGSSEIINETYATLEMNQLVDGYNNMSKRVYQTKNELISQKQRLQVTLDAIADGVIATDVDGKITFMNPAAEHISGWNEKEAKGRALEVIYRLFDVVKNEYILGKLDDTLQKGIVYYTDEHLMLQVRDGKLVDVQSTVSPIRDKESAIMGAVVIFQNVTETRALTQQLHHQATHDPLTGLINRGEFERMLDEILLNMVAGDEHALLYLDLDQFKVVNDTSGHIAGDSLLKQISSILQQAIRDSDLVARLGGDEFAILLPNCSTQQAQSIGEKIRKQISSFSFVWNDSHFRIGVSIGLVPLNHQGMTKTSVLTDADVACYAAKDLGRNRIHIYRLEDEEMMHRRGEMQWITQIRDALENNKLFLYAQKVLPLNNNNQMEHIELLVRHIDKDGILRTPGAFIPAIERYGMAPEFDRWIIKNALENPALIQYLKSGINRCVNINLSGLTLGDTGLTDFISRLLKNAQLPPRSVCFEITETAAVANFNATKNFIDNMSILGCDFALDDFGSGVSSFAYLKNFPVEYLKIDGSLIRDIDHNPINEAMVNAINQIGHVMKMKTIAEFVENKEIEDILVKIGVDYAQGYFIHMPTPLQEVMDEQFLNDAYHTQLHQN